MRRVLDPNLGQLVYRHKFKVECSNPSCDNATEWVDTSEEAVLTWKMKRILTL